MATLARETVVERDTKGRVAGEGVVAVLLEKATPRANYVMEVDTEKCMGCRMCMVDCAAHNAGPNYLPVAYPKAWELLPEAGLFADVVLPAGVKGTTTPKCETCLKGLEEGIDPVCVQICPSGALSVKAVATGKGLTLVR